MKWFVVTVIFAASIFIGVHAYYMWQAVIIFQEDMYSFEQVAIATVMANKAIGVSILSLVLLIISILRFRVERRRPS